MGSEMCIRDRPWETLPLNNSLSLPEPKNALLQKCTFSKGFASFFWKSDVLRGHQRVRPCAADPSPEDPAGGTWGDLRDFFATKLAMTFIHVFTSSSDGSSTAFGAPGGSEKGPVGTPKRSPKWSPRGHREKGLKK